MTLTATVQGETVRLHTPADYDPALFTATLDSDQLLGLDTETTGFPDKHPGVFGTGGQLRLVQVATRTDAWVLDMNLPEQRGAVTNLLADPGRRFVTHSPYDVFTVWRGLGVWLGQRTLDTMLLHQLVSPGGKQVRHGLKKITAELMDSGLADAAQALTDRFRQLAPADVGRKAADIKRWGFTHIPADDETYLRYAALDALYVRRLTPLLTAQCAPYAHLVRTEHWLYAQMAAVTARGIRIDTDRTETLHTKVKTEVDAHLAEVATLTGCNPRSVKLTAWLAEHGAVSTRRTDNGNPSLDKEALAELVHLHGDDPVVGPVLRAKQAAQERTNALNILASFLAYADAAGRVHPNVNTLKAVTARMSMDKPALQTLKKSPDPGEAEVSEDDASRLRECVIAEDGHVLVSADFKAVEVRIAAALAQETKLIDAFHAGADPHNLTAKLMFGDGFTPAQRTLAKRAMFGTLYGIGFAKLARSTGITEDAARDVIGRFRRAYPRLRRFGFDMEKQDTVVTASGRHLPADPNKRYRSLNYVIQSSGRDLLVDAFYKLATTTEYGRCVLLLVHDEIVLQVPTGQAEAALETLTGCMTGRFMGVPIEADGTIHGPRWGAK
ncbi:hypothetical protein I5Q34_00485 [Streptomyces sp. AV19]|uniref:DNA polymerase n=1 Tax=Streptomyces sp. AV19 TaxID=2793068 RepID=UPI0018FE412D|nr:DNA polymerase [Streptomyces sp. AV19]MBH1932785.1 hypothetical protein [Streptomyces sp. AV19]MDG4531456.1 DNA polymerase [Streptomyces sp. AV19]